jgi:UDP-N-acetylglucosamine--N-acetylmuramyl-(pentapeptide) pyrophosphoryl-undecaprenol N-acetylglucosamine transferase
LDVLFRTSTPFVQGRKSTKKVRSPITLDIKSECLQVKVELEDVMTHSATPLNLMKTAATTLPSIWIACGGTGGHFMPGMVVGRALEAKGYEVTYWGEGKRIEVSLCEEQKIDMMRPSAGSRAKRWYSLQKLMNQQAKKAEPTAVLLFGGFSSFALGTWAVRKRVPIHLFEQNTVPGRVNRLLSLFARSVHLTFPLKKYSLGSKEQHLTGNPVRPPVARTAEPKFDVLILGGSQGAASLNQRLPALLDSSFKVCHVCGPGRESEVIKAYPHLKNVTIFESHSNVPELLSQCRWVISRAGATSLWRWHLLERRR